MRGRVRLYVCIDIPLVELVANPSDHLSSTDKEVYCICRLGNDSQLAVNAIRAVHEDIVVKDLIGGLRAWANDVDPTFPIY